MPLPEAFRAHVKAGTALDYGSVERYLTEFQASITYMLDYGGLNVETLRSMALNFDLSRRDFADAWNAYMSELRPISARSTRMQIQTCPRCLHLEFNQNMTGVRNGTGVGESGTVCSKCYRTYYSSCDVCGERRETTVAGVAFVHATNAGTVCGHCVELNPNRYGQCFLCHHIRSSSQLYRYNRIGNGNFEDDAEGETLLCTNCWTPEQSRCKPKFPEFSFPALCLSRDDKLVTQDEIFDIATGGGDVAATGLTEIGRLIQNRTKGNGRFGIEIPELTNPEFNFDFRWQTREGNMPKRIAKILLNNHSLKLTEELMSEIGNIAQRYTSKPGAYRLSITRNVNRPRSEFVHGDSCWWTSYWFSRCALKSLGGFGLRTWDEQQVAVRDSRGRLSAEVKTVPTGRAWMIPVGMNSPLNIRRGHPVVIPTPDVLPAEAYIVFNGYGPHGTRLDSVEFARMVASMTGKSYRKIDMYVSHSLMYVNGVTVGTDSVGKGVLVAEQTMCDQVNEFRLSALPRSCDCQGGRR